MNRYIVLPNAPKAWVSAHDVPEHLPSCTVYEADPAPQPIGLLDADGTPIYRMQERVPMGFVGRRG